MLYRLWFFVFILCGCHNLTTQPASTKTGSKTTQPSTIKISQDDCSAFSQDGIGACHSAYTKNKEFCSFNTANKTCEVLPATGNNYKVIDFSFSQMSHMKNNNERGFKSFICVLLQEDQRPRCFGDFPSNYIQNFDDEYEQIIAGTNHVTGISKRGTFEYIIARLPPTEKLFTGVAIRKSPFSAVSTPSCAISEADELMCVDNSNKNIITKISDNYKNILGIFYNNAPNGVIVYRDKAYAQYYGVDIGKGLLKNRLNYNIKQAAFIRDDDEGHNGDSVLLSDTFQVGGVNPLPGVPKAVAIVPAGVKSFCIIEESSQQIWCEAADTSLRKNIPVAKVKKLKSNDRVFMQNQVSPFAQLCALTMNDKIICFGQDGVDLPMIPSPLTAN